MIPARPLTIAGQQWPSISAAARAASVTRTAFTKRLRAGKRGEALWGRPARPDAKAVEVFGVQYASVREAIAAHGLRNGHVYRRMKRTGETLEEAMLALHPRWRRIASLLDYWRATGAAPKKEHL
jgi:hypothetical protein